MDYKLEKTNTIQYVRKRCDPLDEAIEHEMDMPASGSTGNIYMYRSYVVVVCYHKISDNTPP